MDVLVRPLRPEDFDQLVGAYAARFPYSIDPVRWRTLLDDQGPEFIVLVAEVSGQIAGLGCLMMNSRYPLFREWNIPEIYDLTVAPDLWRRGIATALMDALENSARDKGCEEVGLGVGLYADYGPAHRLYATRGYVLDGRGVTYDQEAVAPGASIAIDDRALIWMTKAL